MSRGSQMTMGGFPTPGPAVKGALLVLFGLWLSFAIAINWGGAGGGLFQLFCGNANAILRGELWRLFTAGLMHDPQGIGDIVFACLGLYFLTPSLEEHWGASRTVRFLIGASVIGYSFQLVLVLALPASVVARLVPEYWFGTLPVVEAIAIAWAFSFRGRTVHLMAVLPITSRGLIFLVVGVTVLRVIAVSMGPEGLLSPFGGMFAGWLLGGSTPSPLRKTYLRFRLAQLDREAQRAKGRRARRAKDSKLRVIDGGKSEKGPDGKWLN